METVPSSALGAFYGERFESLRLLKATATTKTLLGRDLRGGAPVIIKTVAEPSPEALTRLEQESQALSGLEGPGFLPLIAWGHQAGVSYVVTPFVPGITLQERLRRGPLSLPEVLEVGRAMTSALVQAHARSVCHRRIKPNNVIIDDGPTVSRATLIDFCSWSHDSIRDATVETLSYLSPEHACLLSGPIDERSDLYALGVLLFACAAGRAPFPGQTPGGVFRAKLNAQPPALRRRGVDIPRALDDLIQRLLRTHPDDRYQTAAGVACDLSELRRALAGGVRDPQVVIGIEDRRHTLAPPVFVGRERELAFLERRLALAEEGRGRLVVVESEAGGGKSRLLEEFAQRCAGDGAWVLRGQAADQAAVRPLQLVEGVIQGLMARLETDGEFGEHFRAVIGARASAVCRAFPRLERFLPVAGESVGEGTDTASLSLHALNVLLDALGTQSRTAVVILDDVQWADDLTLKLLEQRQQRAVWDPPHQPSRVLVVAALREEEVPAEHPLRTGEGSSALVLAPLPSREVRRLVESMAGRLPDDVVELIAGTAEGNPFAARSVLEGLVEIGALVPGADWELGRSNWSVDPIQMAKVRSSDGVSSLLGHRLERLSPATQAFVSAGAILGKEFSLGMAGAVAGLAEYESALACRDAARRYLISIYENGARCVFGHDEIREAVLVRLAAEGRRALHAAAGATIEAEDPGLVFDLAYHFDNAARSDRALPYALVAAEQARARLAWGVAEHQYRIAERGAEGAGADLRLRVAEALHDVGANQTRWQQVSMFIEASGSQAETEGTLTEPGKAPAGARPETGGTREADGDTPGSHTAELAHAIKNPLAVLRAYLGILRAAAHRDGSGLLDQYLPTMEGALDRIGELVGRLQSAQLRPSRKTAVCVQRVIDEALAEVRPLFAEESGYLIERETASDAPTAITGDPAQLRLVLVNLLVNAHQAMPRGGRVRITVGSHRGVGLEIIVADEGSGLCPAIESRLFEPFVTTKPEGSGLGLWVCKAIVEERHQGEIHLEAVPGGGTAVRVWLPFGPAIAR